MKGITGLIILSLPGVIGAICWPYTINTWLVFFDHPAHIVWWQGFLLGYAPYVRQVSIPAVIITWILMLFL